MDGKHSQGAASTKSAPAYKDLGLTKEDLLEMYRKMVLSRTLDERIWMMNRQGKVPIFASCQGHEAAQAAVARALRTGQDIYYIYYRDLPLVVALGITPKELMIGYLAKAGDTFNGARQFPLHGTYAKLNVISLSNVVAPHVLQATGAALACKIRHENRVVFTTFGDGASSQGDVHEALNFAAIHKLPIIFFCENNHYATSTPLHKQMAVESVADRASGYGMPGIAVDGMDILRVYQVMKEAAERARTGKGPTLIEVDVERLMPHTSDDDDTRYRTKEDLEHARARDPLKVTHQFLMSEGILTEAVEKQFADAAKKEVNEATEFADKAPYPGTSDFYDHLYASKGDA